MADTKHDLKIEENQLKVIEEKPLKSNEEKDEDLKQKFKEKSFPNKMAYLKDNITVEPLLAGLIIPSVISRFAMSNLNLDKACRVNLGFDDHICDELIKRTSNNYSSYEKEVQKLISSIDIWKSVIHTLLPCLLIMFLGAWSDRTGKRKIIILLPVIGELLATFGNLVSVFFFYEIPVEITVFIEVIFTSISGGWVTMFLGVFSYISDITSEKTRTFRVGLVNFCMTCGLPIGIAMSGILLKKMGYYGVFSMVAVLFCVVLLYGFVCLKDPDDWLIEKGLPVITREPSNSGFFNLHHVAETLQVALKPRDQNRRVKVILTLAVVFITFGPSMAEHSIQYLFVRNQLNWDMVQYGLYTSYAIILHSFELVENENLQYSLQQTKGVLPSYFRGTIFLLGVMEPLEPEYDPIFMRYVSALDLNIDWAMFSITVLSKKLQVDDSMLCLISLSSKFVGTVWTAFVRSNLEMYLVPVVEILNATTFTSLRSIISKLVDKQENAKVNSLFSLTETLASLGFNPLYSWLYLRTLSSFPGTVFLVTAALTLPASAVLIFFFVQHRRSLKSARKKALEAEERIEQKEAGPLPFSDLTVIQDTFTEKTQL